MRVLQEFEFSELIEKIFTFCEELSGKIHQHQENQTLQSQYLYKKINREYGCWSNHIF